MQKSIVRKCRGSLKISKFLLEFTRSDRAASGTVFVRRSITTCALVVIIKIDWQQCYYYMFFISVAQTHRDLQNIRCHHRGHCNVRTTGTRWSDDAARYKIMFVFFIFQSSPQRRYRRVFYSVRTVSYVLGTRCAYVYFLPRRRVHTRLSNVHVTGGGEGEQRVVLYTRDRQRRNGHYGVITNNRSTFQHI